MATKTKKANKVKGNIIGVNYTEKKGYEWITDDPSDKKRQNKNMKQKTRSKTPIIYPPDTRFMSHKERADADAAYLRSIGYKEVKIVKHGRGYRVEASSKGG